MKKIGIFVPNLKNNGVSRVASLHSTMFFQEGYHIDLIVEENITAFPYSGNLVNLNIKKRNGPFKLISFISIFLKIKKLKKQNNYDYFISHIPHCDIINVLTKNNEYVITTIHNNIDRRYSNITKRILNLIFKKSDAIVSVSRGIAEKLSKQHKNKYNIVNIPNPIDFNHIYASIDTPPPTHLQNKKYILNIGRLDEQKGQWHLIKAFYLLSQEIDDLYLVIIGEGPEYTNLLNLCEKLKIHHKVFFEGFQENPFIYMKHSSAFVFPSLYEGFPMVLIEAMSCNIPIVSTDCFSGPRELLINNDTEYGILIPDKANYNEIDNANISTFDVTLAESVRLILNNSIMATSMANRAKVRADNFSLKNIYKEWNSLFQKLRNES
ncbi:MULTISPECIES: glycosyltransferase [Providencia]|uniref:glycosyltransferase n=1 Tax=Providencia TaxID=586 RepID=UPI001419D32C|nr:MULTISPECIES: glycosyltransferase [Providencia]ELR5146631.1 glycosyltransferase [Providencia rettgeri]NIA44654.1 glycosyltransferase [Providencia rettgeri]NIA96918.1 glycosyltransferase [Providencia rettgeri]NIB14742.1 glycosyltransferase [Providencia rettgeri]NIB34954.1 glycosyltransferase [Providencia rettgeri]